jgi:hypothetical protein
LLVFAHLSDKILSFWESGKMMDSSKIDPVRVGVGEAVDAEQSYFLSPMINLSTTIHPAICTGPVVDEQQP